MKSMYVSTMSVLAGIVSMLTPISNLTAKEIAVYRWVDANNVVHFSQNLPKTDDYTELSTVSSFNALSKDARKEIALQKDIQQNKDSITQEQELAKAQNKAMFDKNCKAAQLNNKMLNSYDEVLMTEEDSNGIKKERVLSDKEKQEKLILSKKNIDLYCDN